jgi:hypothetical protein
MIISHQPLVYGLAHVVDDMMKLGRDRWVFRDAAREDERGGVEQSPCGLVAPFVGGMTPLEQDIGDALKVDDAVVVHLDDGMVRELVGDGGALIERERLVLLLALHGDGLDQLAHETWQSHLQLCRVLGADDAIAAPA